MADGDLPSSGADDRTSAPSDIPRRYVDIVAVHRAAHRISRYVGRRPAKLLLLAGNMLFSSSVPFECSIGAGTIFEHRGLGVVLHPETVIGRNCRVLPQVTMGGRGGDVPGAPTVGDDVVVSTGAKLLGAISVGSRAVIGANAVVLIDVPPAAVAVGVPARIL